MTPEAFLAAPTGAPTTTSDFLRDPEYLDYSGVVVGDGEMIPAPRFEAPSASILALAERQDLGTFRQEWERHGGNIRAELVKFIPDAQSVRDVLDTSPDWAVFGGHFEDGLYNSLAAKPFVQLTFHSEYVLFQYRFQEEQIRPDRGFSMHRRIKVSIWRGCSVFREIALTTNPHNRRVLDFMAIERIRALRSLFGPHLMLGFNAGMGWDMTQLAFGGGVKWNGVVSRVQRGLLSLTKDRMNDMDAIREAWLTCTAPILNKNGVHENYTRFCAVDPEGYYWTNDRLTGEIIQVTRV